MNFAPSFIISPLSAQRMRQRVEVPNIFKLILRYRTAVSFMTTLALGIQYKAWEYCLRATFLVKASQINYTRVVSTYKFNLV
jgi:hypothetical protein